jgi:HEAT repeat protein/beta-lactamase regulating signal transducer with metallopeptidase domain
MRELGLGWALGILLKGTALLLCAFVLAALLRRASAGLRHLVWSGGVIALLVLPVASITLPWRLPVIATTGLLVMPAEPAPSGVTARIKDAARERPAPSWNAEAPDAGSPMRLPSPAALTQLLLAIWLAGSALVLGRLLLGAVIVRRIVRRATPLQSPDWTRPLLEAADRLALDRVPRLVTSSRLPMPFACGVLRPAIVLPVAAREWTDRRRRAVLFHELAHVRRLDLPVNALAQLACALYWINPLVWVAARKLRMESERACDDLVLGAGTRPSEYADHLLQIVCRTVRARTPAVALPMAERREFEGRMLAILERDARRGPPLPRQAAALAVLAVALLMPLAALGPARQASQQVAQETKQATDVARPMAANAGTRSSGAVPGGASPRANRRPATDRKRTAPTPAREPLAAKHEAEKDRVSDTQSQSDTVSAKVVAALIGALGDSVASVREDAAYALGRLDARAGVTGLVARLARDPDAGVRKMAAWALAQIGSRDAIPALGAGAQGDAAESVRAMAVWALGQLDDATAIPALTAALADKSAEVRGRAAWAMGTIGPRSAPQALVAALRDADAPVRVRAAWALGRIADDAAVPVLSAALKDADAEVRKAAFWALGQMGEAAQPALLEALKDSDPQIRARAARALAGAQVDPWPWPWPMPIIR